MTYLAFQMVGALLIAAAFGAALLWLGQWTWGRLRAPMKWRVLELEVEELKRERARFHGRLTDAEDQVQAAEQASEQQRRARRQLTATLDARNRAFQELESQLVASERRLRVAETAPPGTAAVRESIAPEDGASGDADLLRTQQELRHALITQERLRAEVEVLKDISTSAESELQGLRVQLREAEANAAVPQSRPPAWVMAEPIGAKDNLQELEGVDGEMEHSLNRLGIYHYHQIARFDANDVEWVAEHVDGVPAGIVRDSWIPAAAQLSGLRRAH